MKRKIGKNQVRALRINLSGSKEDMRDIVAEGKLNEWCTDSMNWMKDTFGEQNIVSADLHMDETTPHIHVTVVPIVTGERRKAKTEQEKNKSEKKKQYKKKNTNAPRLCADDVMTREKLKYYQDSYAEAMSKYGLERGEEGSKARHTTTQEHYRELFLQKDRIEQKLESLQERETEANEKIGNLYDHKDRIRDEFLVIDEQLKQKKAELSAVEMQLEEVKSELDPDHYRSDLTLLYEFFPLMKELLKWTKYCLGIGFSKDEIRQLATFKPVQFTGELYSKEHNRRFNAKDITAKLEADPVDKTKLRLTINGQHIIGWFRKLFQSLNSKIKNHNRSKGMKR